MYQYACMIYYPFSSEAQQLFSRKFVNRHNVASHLYFRSV